MAMITKVRAAVGNRAAHSVAKDAVAGDGWEAVPVAGDQVVLRETATGIETLPMSRSTAEAFRRGVGERVAARPANS